MGVLRTPAPALRPNVFGTNLGVGPVLRFHTQSVEGCRTNHETDAVEPKHGSVLSMTSASMNEGDGDHDEGAVDIETARARIRARGEQIRRAQTDRALRKLRERTDLSNREEQVVEELAANLTGELLKLPERRLADLDRCDERDDLVPVAVQMFGEN